MDESLKGKINHYEIWIPIPFTASKDEFKIGSIWIGKITSDLVDSWIPINHEIADEDHIKTKDDFPDPESPVTTVKPSDKSTSIFLKLCSAAPRISINTRFVPRYLASRYAPTMLAILPEQVGKIPRDRGAGVEETVLFNRIVGEIVELTRTTD